MWSALLVTHLYEATTWILRGTKESVSLILHFSLKENTLYVIKLVKDLIAMKNKLFNILQKMFVLFILNGLTK